MQTAAELLTQRIHEIRPSHYLVHSFLHQTICSVATIKWASKLPAAPSLDNPSFQPPWWPLIDARWMQRMLTADSIPAPHLRSILICLRLWLLRPPLIQLQCYIAPCLDLNVHCSGYPGLIMYQATPPERVTIISFTLAKVKQIICYGPIFKTFSSRQPWRRSAVGTSHYNCYSPLLKMLVWRLGAADSGLDQVKWKM